MAGRFTLLILIVVQWFLGVGVPPVAADPDWEALGQEAGGILSQYIRIDTTNPPGNELPGARFLERILADDGIGSTVYFSADTRANLLARLPGEGDEEPLLLLNHIDVVPADPAEWSVPPFGGEIREGFVYGRGALDDKGRGVMQLVALLAHHRERRPCNRPLVFLAVADEEVGGKLGARFMAEHHPDQLRAVAVWNEGGASVEGILGDQLVNSVAVTQKSTLWITLAASGEGGHGSAPTPNGAINILVPALVRVAEWKTPVHLVPSMREAFDRIGAAMFPGGRFVMRNLDKPLIGLIAAGRITKHRATNALVRNTIALTGLRAGVKHNVIPHRAEADLDVRLLPDQQPEEFLVDLKAVIDDPRIEVLLRRDIPEFQTASPSDSSFFTALQDSLAERLPGSVTIPGMLAGGSDCRVFRAIGIPCYGYAPMVVTPELIGQIHGVDERISIDNLRLGVEVTYDVIGRLCER